MSPFVEKLKGAQSTQKSTTALLHIMNRYWKTNARNTAIDLQNTSLLDIIGKKFDLTKAADANELYISMLDWLNAENKDDEPGDIFRLRVEEINRCSSCSYNHKFGPILYDDFHTGSGSKS
eukprot:TRINITY_DN6559_c0_g1_i2.p1 TRINITY_DN6559_c0_g1~~TRINITY_DN6559_c0_g1_i2.p1  ORF type:complete len:121 (-),score=13.04 TRINITY_DN6559_c0_g1_i2:465-827(-)